MTEIRPVEPVIRFCAVISRHQATIEWALERLAEQWGGVVLQSGPHPFEAGGFYADSMGRQLQKRLVALDGFLEPGGLADWKHETNGWESEYAATHPHEESRPLNLDPGYVTQAKLVLATTKDRDHRIYLREGMFAEVTLNYVGGEWVHHRWTYPDYRTDAVAAFAQACRDRLREHLVASGGFRRVGGKPVEMSSRRITD